MMNREFLHGSGCVEGVFEWGRGLRSFLPTVSFELVTDPVFQFLDVTLHRITMDVLQGLLGIECYTAHGLWAVPVNVKPELMYPSVDLDSMNTFEEVFTQFCFSIDHDVERVSSRFLSGDLHSLCVFKDSFDELFDRDGDAGFVEESRDYVFERLVTLHLAAFFEANDSLPVKLYTLCRTVVCRFHGNRKYGMDI